MPVTLLSDPACHQTKAIKILGEYCGIKFSVEKGASKDAKSCLPSVVKCDDGTLLGDLTAIMIHLADDKLLGSSKVNKAKVIQWLNLVNQFHHTSSQWLLPTIGQAEGTKQSVEKAKTEAKKVLKSLNDHLLSNSYLVGERISVADICLAATLLPLYEKMFDAKARGEYPNLTRYLDTLVHQPQFQAVVGQIKYCETAPVFKEGAVKKEQPKKEEKPKQAKKAPEPDDGGDFDDDGLPKEKPKDPWLALPKGNFDMDDFKRFFSNNPEDKSIPYFWEKFDKENFSIWFCEYKYPEELTLVFMSCNLITGMFQRLDKMRKWAFGSMLLFGEDHKNSISGVWVWRGQDLAFKLSPDWQVDYESYDWKKLDPDSPDTKKIVDEYFRWEGDFGGKKFNQGKIFK